MTDLAFASIAELAPRLAAREISPVEVTEAALARLEQLEPQLNAFITVTAESARHAARAAEAAILAGHYLGPLHGIPVAIKDLYATRGVATTFGSPLYADWVPDFDAAAVEQLKRAGAVLLGKTNLHELAYGSTSANAHYGAVHNPWRLDHHPGGSSGGSSAAVAAGMAYGAMGSDTGASIRQPAACTGIVGIKPTFGRLSKFGALPLAWSQDHAGPLTRTVRDAALMLQVLAGHDPRDPSSVARPVPDFTAGIDDGIAGRRIGVARAFFFDDCAADVVAAVDAALGCSRSWAPWSKRWRCRTWTRRTRSAPSPSRSRARPFTPPICASVPSCSARNCAPRSSWAASTAAWTTFRRRGCAGS